MKRLVVIGDSDIAYWPKDLLPSIIAIPIIDRGNILRDSGYHDCAAAATKNTTVNDNDNTNDNDWDDIITRGHSGATLSQILPHLQQVLAGLSSSSSRNGSNRNVNVNNKNNANKNTKKKMRRKLEKQQNNSNNSNNDNNNTDDNNNNNLLVIVACAGENDIGDGIPLEESVEAFRKFVDTILHYHRHDDEEDDNCGHHDCNSNDMYNNKKNNTNNTVCLIFFGPKFEPWQDIEEGNSTYSVNYSKKQYSALSRSFQRCLVEVNNDNNNNNDRNKNNSNNNDDKYQKYTTTSRRTTSNGTVTTNYHSYYINCLTMFCTATTACVPGAILCGRAQADPNLFKHDQLHLNDHGYTIWKDVVETILKQIRRSIE